MALDVERVLDGGVNRQNRWADPGVLKRCILRSRRRVRLMRILGPIVLAQAPLVVSRQADFGLCRGVERSLSVTSTSGAKPCFLSSLRISFTAAACRGRRCTSRSRTSPSSSTARHSQNCRPAIATAISTLGAGVDGEVLGRTTVRTSRPIAAPFRLRRPDRAPRADPRHRDS